MINNIFLSPKNLSIIDTEEKISLPEKIKEDVNKLWETKLASNNSLFNGPIYSIAEIVKADDYINIHMCRSSYSHFLHSKSTGFIGDHVCRSVAVSALLITKDNFYCLGIMAEHTSYPNVIQCPGGAIDPIDIRDNIFNTWESVKREVKEEIGLSLEDNIVNNASQNKYIITRKNLSYIGICFVIELSLTSKELDEIFIVHQKNSKGTNELQKLIYVKRETESLVKFINNENLIKIDYLNNLLLVDIGKEKCEKWL
ncbi:NUDIX hydrolase [Psychrobacillus sp. L4]|uniref:NUDIX hydrolase n=1 Tax=Psychrobacillus sp. L4 TaxID=3236892 RepID=UPI0036F419D5